MIKVNVFSQIIVTIEEKKKTLQQLFCQKQKQLQIKIGCWVSSGKQGFKKLRKLPQNYRNIAAKIVDPVMLVIFTTAFTISLILPTNQAEKIRQVFLASPKNFNNQMNIVQVLIANGYLKTAKKELDKIGNPEFLTKEEKEVWQKNYLTWGLHSPEGQDRLIDNWEKFLEKFSNYKIGWVYLGYFQSLRNKEQEAQESFHKAEKIDPGLEEEIKKITNFQIPINQ
ncbi:MAG: hypothetical protein PHR64_00255 [Candidatus Shapirobacteria bacterium]|nr:hypothetical protein [Candidatus Shapirobacteria bacterium]MDD5073618.1 hypothetical protein [Candidatus Shapirobacteria bacterium]MDD5481371.1 hypothetical protein [Candidatus Shapirobacteria bacterium]